MGAMLAILELHSLQKLAIKVCQKLLHELNDEYHKSYKIFQDEDHAKLDLH